MEVGYALISLAVMPTACVLEDAKVTNKLVWALLTSITVYGLAWESVHVMNLVANRKNHMWRIIFKLLSLLAGIFHVGNLFIRLLDICDHTESEILDKQVPDLICWSLRG